MLQKAFKEKKLTLDKLGESKDKEKVGRSSSKDLVGTSGEKGLKKT